MQQIQANSRQKKMLRLSSCLGALVAALGIAGIIAWIFNATVWISLDPEWIPMAPSTAVFFALLGFALVAINQNFGRKCEAAIMLCTSLVLGFALLLFYSSFNLIFFPIERLGLPIASNLKGIPLGHISPLTAIGMALAAFTILVFFLKKRSGKQLLWLALVPTILLLAIGWLLTTAYIVGGPLLYDTSFIPPASTTSGGLLLLGVALLAISLSDFDFSFNPSRSTRILLLILAFLIAGTTATGYLYFRTFQAKLAKTVNSSVRSLIREKIRHFSAWLAEKTAQAKIFHNNENFNSLVELYLSDPENEQIRNRFEHWLFKLGNNPDFSAVFMVRLSDSSLHGNLGGKKYFDVIALRDLVNKVSTDNRVRLSDLLRNPHDGSFFSVFTVPVTIDKNDNLPRAILCIVINPENYLFPMLESWPAEDAKVQTLLTSRDKDSYRIIDFRPSEVANGFSALDHAILIKNIKKFNPASFFSFQFLNAEKRQFSAFVEPVPTTNWQVLTIIDTKELNHTAIERLGIVVMVIGLLLLVSALGIMSLWFQQNRALFMKQQEAAQALIESEKNLRSLFDNMLDGILVAETDSRIFCLANSAICRMLGYEKTELLKMQVKDIHPAENLEEAFAAFQKSLDGELDMAHRIPMKRKDGTTFFADISAALITFGNKPCLMGVFRDVSEQELAERKILHLNSALSGIRHVNQLITRETDPIRLIDLACEKLFDARGFDSVVIGAIAEERKLTHLNGCGPMTEKFKAVASIEELPGSVQRCLAEKTTIVENDDEQNFSFALPFVHGDFLYGFIVVQIKNNVINLEDEKSLLEEAADDIAFALHTMKLKEGLHESVKALEKTEEQLRQSQKLDAIGQLAGGIAHDFNNLLMVQMGYCELLLQSMEEPEQESYLQLIYECAQKAATLTRQLLAFSRKQTLQVEVIDLNKLLTNMIKMLMRLIGENIRIETSLMDNLSPILVDPGQIEQILINLVVNARDAMKNGGKIVISTSNVRQDENEYVKLTISDTGEGIAPEIKEKIFEPFFTTKSKDKGTGLGLATVYGIVKQSNGWIELESEIGTGSSFNIFFPKSQMLDTGKKGEQKNEKPWGKGRNILLVEDEENLRLLLKRFLIGMGFQVTSASNGIAALKEIENSSIPDLVITDMVMPEMSGKELIKEVRKMAPETRFLCMSGYTEDFRSLFADELDNRQISFIQKPFVRKALLEKINDIFHA